MKYLQEIIFFSSQILIAIVFILSSRTISEENNFISANQARQNTEDSINEDIKKQLDDIFIKIKKESNNGTSKNYIIINEGLNKYTTDKLNEYGYYVEFIEINKYKIRW